MAYIIKHNFVSSLARYIRLHTMRLTNEQEFYSLDQSSKSIPNHCPDSHRRLSQLHVTYTPVRATKGLVHNMQPNRLKQGSIHHATDQSRCKNMW